MVKLNDDKAHSEGRLNHKIKELKEQGLNVDYKVVVGDIYEDLDKTAHVMKATLIVMGTHGIQNIFGSHAQKVVDNSHSPFILLQEAQEKKDINTIVMPFNFARESLQITEIAAVIAEKFNAKIHLVGNHESDEWLERDFKVNGAIVGKFLNEHNIRHDMHAISARGEFAEELLEFSNTVNADLIAAAFYVEGFLSYYHSFLDAMITNKYKIPVLTVNGKEMMTLNSRFTFITT